MKTTNSFEVEREQFIPVMRANQNLIYKICHSYCPDPESRKDLQQEILMQLWNSFSKFDGRVKISTWIYRIALNTAISYYRKDCKHRNNKVAMDASVISLSGFEQESEQDERIVMLYQFIERLDEMDKALMLLYLDGNKYKDIADVLGISETNVATKISRIKKSLKGQLTNH